MLCFVPNDGYHGPQTLQEEYGEDMEDWESCCSSSEGANRTRGNWKTESHHTISLNTPLEKNAPHGLFGLFGVRRCSAFCTSRFRNPPTVARSVWPGNGGALPIVSRKRSSGFRFYKPFLHFCIHRAQTFGIRVPPPNEIRCVIERVCDTGMKQRMKDSDAVTHCSSKFLKIGKVDETGSIFFCRGKKTHANYETILFANICSDVYQFVSIVLRRLDHGWTYCIRKNCDGQWALCQASSAPRSVPGRARMFRCSIVFHSFRFVKIL